MTQEIMDAAALQVETELKDDKVLVVFLPDCHESLAGIVAGRIRERYNKPVLSLQGQKGCAKGIRPFYRGLPYVPCPGRGKGSAAEIRRPSHGGRFSLEEADVGEFRRRLNENAADKLTPDDFIPRVWIDVAMPFEYISEELICDLERLEPFGQGNEKPQFAPEGHGDTKRPCNGKNRNVVRLSLVNERGFSMDGIVFGDGDAFMEEMGSNRQIDIIYYPL